MYALFPYKVDAEGDPNHGKWVFVKQKSHMDPNTRNFRTRTYYGEIADGWITNNPRLVKNPFQ